MMSKSANFRISGLRKLRQLKGRDGPPSSPCRVTKAYRGEKPRRPEINPPKVRCLSSSSVLGESDGFSVASTRDQDVGRETPRIYECLAPSITQIKVVNGLRYAINVPNFGDYHDPGVLATLAREAEEADNSRSLSWT